MSKYAKRFFAPQEYHTIEPFRFPVYHELVGGEAEFLEEMNRREAKQTYRMLRLAQRISQDNGITIQEALEVLSNPNTDKQDLLYRYLEEVNDINAALANPRATTHEIVTMFMQLRAEAQNASGTWEQLADWTMDDTHAMPSTMVDRVFELLRWERDGWPTEEPVGNGVELKTTSRRKPSSEVAKAS
jgi:hypothetical protein